MANIKRANASSITKSGVAIADVPDAPTIGAVTDTVAGGTVTVAYTAAVTGGAATTFTATSSPGGITGTGSSPINVTGLTDGTAYTFTVTASNTTGSSAPSAASSSVTPTSWLTGAYDSIATSSPSAGTAFIDFTSIPSTYTHLQIRALLRSNDGSAGNNLGIYARFNSDAGSNYAFHFLTSNGSTAGSAGIGGQTEMFINAANPRNGDTANAYSGNLIDILDYANTTKNKTVRTFSGDDLNGSGVVRLTSGLWMSTAAITSIRIFMEGNFAANSQLALYGIKGN